MMNQVQNVYDARIEIKEVVIKPNCVVVLSRQYFNVDEYFNDSEGKHLSLISRTFLMRDTWVQYDRIWMLKRSEQLDLDLNIIRNNSGSGGSRRGK
jgi:hypothetical protein